MAVRPQLFELDAAEAERLTGGRWLGAMRSVCLHGATVDSRRVRPGNLFVCVVGQQVDGHDYAATAVGDGAALVLASRAIDDELPVPVLLVDDVVPALAAVARAFRQRYQGATWIGVTGSNGKTTVKELLAAALADSGAVHCTAGNFNNQYGLPLTVLDTPPDRRYVIIEMGASGPGDIDHLASIVRPQIGVITGIGPAHLEGFGDLVGVARGKSELFEHVAADGSCLFARDGLEAVAAGCGADVDELLAIIRAAAGERQLTEVGGVGCAIDGEELPRGVLLRTPVGEVQLRLDGRHNLANACLAWHTAIAAGVDARHALASLAQARPASGRLQIRRLGEHLIFDDSYNANPASMAAGLAVLARQPGARLAVLGAMGELGVDSVDSHRRVGAVAARHGLALLTVGDQAHAIADGYLAAGGRDQEHAVDCPTAISLVLDRMRIGPTAVLVKASRSAGMEQIVSGLAKSLGYATTSFERGDKQTGGDDGGEDAAC